MPKLALPQVTLCCVDTTGRIPSSLQAIGHCLQKIDFGDAILLTLPELLLDQKIPAGLRIVPIDPLKSIEAYSHFMVKSLAPYIQTAHCLVVQWDGYIVQPSQWTDEFLAFDYIGAPWANADGSMTVGNGGFSLRSKKLLGVLQSDSITAQHPEDACICTANRSFLESQGIVFAPVELASRFSVETGMLNDQVFGFHGPHHLPQLLGPQEMVGFIESFSAEKILSSNLFDMLLRELTVSARRDPAFQPALQSLVRLIHQALNGFRQAATQTEYSDIICKALIRYGQYSAAAKLLEYRFEASGVTWMNAKMYCRLSIYRLLSQWNYRR